MISSSRSGGRRQRGFTLIELLIVVAIIGIVAAILIPNLIDAVHKAKQKRTVADIRILGGAWFSWYSDQVSSAAAGAAQTADWPLSDTMSISHAELTALLQPSTEMRYIQQVPRFDGWRTEYEFVVTNDADDIDALQKRVVNIMGIRSLGRDGLAGSTPYELGPFLSTDYSQDIVWADGYLVRFPAGVSGSSTP